MEKERADDSIAKKGGRPFDPLSLSFAQQQQFP
jgi:hypothetical protein